MHELSIVESMLNIVRDSAAQNNIKKVKKINLVIGKLSMVLPDSLQFGFEVLSSQEDLFQGSILEIDERETVIWCKKCQCQYTLTESCSFICPECGEVGIEIVSGREMYLNYYEGDEC